jgi:hypothetical protein
MKYFARYSPPKVGRNPFGRVAPIDLVHFLTHGGQCERVRHGAAQRTRRHPQTALLVRWVEVGLSRGLHAMRPGGLCCAPCSAAQAHLNRCVFSPPAVQWHPTARSPSITVPWAANHVPPTYRLLAPLRVGCPLPAAPIRRAREYSSNKPFLHLVRRPGVGAYPLPLGQIVLIPRTLGVLV